jgi:prolyl-tRNA synthetase
MADLAALLAPLSLAPREHAAAASPAEWAAALESLGAPHTPTKTLLFNPKAAGKTADAPPLVLLFAHADTQTPSGALAKHLGFKEMRLAAEDAMRAALNAGKDDSA